MSGLGLSARLSFVQPLSLAFADKAGLRHPASAALRLRLAGRCPNSSSLFPPLAAVVVVAPSRGASGEIVHFAGNAKASPTRRGGTASAVTERLYKDGPANYKYKKSKRK
nr:MAG TPA: hypothetical protein [Bacteriophage sp.]